MSDFCMYGLEDIVWEEFGQSDDHIVPHPGNKHGNENVFQSDSRNKPQHEVSSVSGSAGNRYAAKFVNQGKEEGDFPILKNRRKTMLEKDSWSHTPEGVFPASCDSDSTKKATSLASDNSRMSSHCFKSSNEDSFGSEFCANDPSSDGRCAAVDSDSCHYPLGHISQTDNDLNFFNNDSENKESSDLLYYGWPDIGNFEDVDRMFRSCDSTFGLGVVVNADELGWFSSSHAIEGSEDVQKSDFKFISPESNPSKNIPDHREPSKLNIASSSIDVSNMENASVSYKTSSWTSGNGEPVVLGHSSFMNASSTISECKDKFTPNEEGVAFNGGFPFKISTINYSKNGNNAMESSCASNRLQSIKSTHNRLFEASAIMDKKRENLHIRPSFISNRKHVDLVVPASNCNPISVGKHVHSENKVENCSEVGGVSMGIPAELGSLNVQEISSMGFGLDEISLESTSFHQLQHVMEQLDIKTKLCIRDSLYRLARSAEQRHNYANLNGGSRDDRETSGELMDEETNKCTGIMDMETNTNPIDRSIAHLLFHRPLDSSIMVGYDSKSQSMIHGSITSPPVMSKKLVCQDENATAMDEKGC